MTRQQKGKDFVLKQRTSGRPPRPIFGPKIFTFLRFTHIAPIFRRIQPNGIISSPYHEVTPDNFGFPAGGCLAAFISQHNTAPSQSCLALRFLNPEVGNRKETEGGLTPHQKYFQLDSISLQWRPFYLPALMRVQPIYWAFNWLTKRISWKEPNFENTSDSLGDVWYHTLLSVTLVAKLTWDFPHCNPHWKLQPKCGGLRWTPNLKILFKPCLYSGVTT